MPAEPDPTDPADAAAFIPDDDFLAAVRHGVAAHRRRVRHRFTASLALVAVLAGSGIWYANDRLSSVQRIDMGPAADGPDPLGKGAPFNVLLLGFDTCDLAAPGAGSHGPENAAPDIGRVCEGRLVEGLADTIAVAHVDPIGHRVNLLSFYRDLVFDTESPKKLNSLGIEGLRNELSTRLDIDIDHVVSISMAGFRELADRFDIRIRLGAAVRDRATGLSLEPGCQSVEPAQLLALTRARHLETRRADGSWTPDQTAEIGRVARQGMLFRIVFQAFKAQGLSPADLDGLVDDVLPHVAVDEHTSNAELLRLARLLQTSELNTVGAVPVATGGSETISYLYLSSILAPRLAEVLHQFDGRPIDAASEASTVPTTAATDPDPSLTPFGTGWDDLAAC